MVYQKFHYYRVAYIHFVTSDIFIFRVKPMDSKRVFSFQPGQYVEIVNPRALSFYHHYFSVASSPTSSEYLEFCIRVTGPWTLELAKIKKGEHLFISDPKGSFFLKEGIMKPAFLAGGVGVAPFISMIRSIREQQLPIHGILLYCARNSNNTPYADELAEISKNRLRVVYVFEHEKGGNKSKSYHGLLTKDILRKEIRLHTFPTFFISGPQVFTRYASSLVSELGVREHYIRKE